MSSAVFIELSTVRFDKLSQFAEIEYDRFPVHCAEYGCPIVNDTLVTQKRSAPAIDTVRIACPSTSRGHSGCSRAVRRINDHPLTFTRGIRALHELASQAVELSSFDYDTWRNAKLRWYPTLRENR